MHREWTGSGSGMLIPKRKKTIEVWYLEVEWGSVIHLLLVLMGK